MQSLTNRKPIAYRAERTNGRVVAFVEYQGGLKQGLPHRVLHSPAGFDLGSGGAGSVDLARSILAHFVGRITAPEVAQDFAWEFVAKADDELYLNAETIAAWLRVRCPEEVAR